MKTWHGFVILVFCAAINADGQFLFDDFEDGVLDPLKWKATTPFSNSTVTESGGVLTLANRGTVTAVPGFETYTLSCRFRFTDHFQDILYVAIRSNGSIGGQFSVPLTGLRLAIHPSAFTASKPKRFSNRRKETTKYTKHTKTRPELPGTSSLTRSPDGEATLEDFQKQIFRVFRVFRGSILQMR